MKICKALVTDVTIAGGARVPVILNAGIGFCMFYGNVWLVPIFIITHILIVRLTKKDAKFFDHFISAMKHEDRYEA